MSRKIHSSEAIGHTIRSTRQRLDDSEQSTSRARVPLDLRVREPLTLDLSHKERCGRGLVVKQDGACQSVASGDTLISAFASAVGLSPPARQTLCSVCLEDLSSALRKSECAGCGEVRFCADCADTHGEWHTSSGECEAFATGGSSLGAEGALLLRSIALAGLPKGDEADDEIKHKGKSRNDEDCFWDLVGAPEDLSADMRSNLAATAAVLLSMVAVMVAPELTSVEVVALGLAKLACNSHAFGGCDGGRALWPRVELMNHACNPSAYMVVTPVAGKGLQASVRALRELPPGALVTISYQPGLGGLTSTERREVLGSKLGWTCSCEACSHQLHDQLLTQRTKGAGTSTLDDGNDDDESAVVQRALADLKEGANEAEATLALSQQGRGGGGGDTGEDGDGASGGAAFASFLARGLLRGALGSPLRLGPSHSLVLHLRALHRDVTWAVALEAAARASSSSSSSAAAAADDGMTVPRQAAEKEEEAHPLSLPPPPPSANQREAVAGVDGSNRKNAQGKSDDGGDEGDEDEDEDDAAAFSEEAALEAVEAARAWAAAAEPVVELLDPCELCHGFASLALALHHLAQQSLLSRTQRREGREEGNQTGGLAVTAGSAAAGAAAAATIAAAGGGADVAKEAAQALGRAALLARTTLGANDSLTVKLDSLLGTIN